MHETFQELPKFRPGKKLSPKEVILILQAEESETNIGKIKENDFLGLRRRAYLFQTIYDAYVNQNQKELGAAYQRLEKLTYPWLSQKGVYKSVKDLASSFSGRGIVMTSGKWHFKYARHAVNYVRRIGSTLPIEMFYVGEDDLPKEMRQELEKVPNLRCIDLKPLIDTDGPEVRGWAVKPFSMLLSSFKEIIFLDADALFFQNPDVLFDFKLYGATGAVFFRDRTLFGGGDNDGLRLFKSMVPLPSEYAKTEGRTVRMISQHEGESGVIVWDKTRNLHAFLLVCTMNSEPYRKTLYHANHGKKNNYNHEFNLEINDFESIGDKESYWMAHEALELPYRWAPGGGGTVGYVEDPEKKPNSICGGLYHPDENWKPLWFNGGILRNKYTGKGKQVMEITHWATDRTFGEPVALKWQWETETSPFCLQPPNTETEVGELTEDEKKKAKLMVDVWDQLEETENKE